MKYAEAKEVKKDEESQLSVKKGVLNSAVYQSMIGENGSVVRRKSSQQLDASTRNVKTEVVGSEQNRFMSDLGL